MPASAQEEYVLGLDLGTNSLGWALVRRRDGRLDGLIRAGTRIFEGAMEGDIESGKEESRNLKRREARLHRRQLWRRARRLRMLFRTLQRLHLLPQGTVKTPKERQDFLNELDRRIFASEWFGAKQRELAIPRAPQVLPYLLRAAALDEPLELYSLGRAIFHLAQRRGFLSNRKQAPARKETQEEEGKVKQGIAELRDKMAQAGARTLGEFFSRLDPGQERIRGRWTARQMYEDEFKRIWNAQRAHHPTLLTDANRRLLFRILFYQRPLKIKRSLVGRCELEPRRRRAPAYLLSSQRFRLLQTVNNLKVAAAGETERELSSEQRLKLITALEVQGSLTFPKVRKLLDLPGKCAFNLERGGEERLPGNRTAAAFYAALGPRWLQISPDEQDRMVQYVHAFERPERLSAAAKKKWELDDTAAEKLAEISLEGEYLSHSRQAIEKLLPLLEKGIPYATARRQLYPEQFESAQPLALLPPVKKVIAEIRNPSVMRSLTELRKVVNAIVLEYGKPAEIRIELARDLRNSKKQREEMSKRNRGNEKARGKAAQRILEEMPGRGDPSRDEIRKVLLAEECGWQCPYTGKQISMRALVGPEPQFDVEHILPFSRSLDNSFSNLTLCYNEENRNAKHNRTPLEAYSGNPERYQQILSRVKRFQSNSAAEKLRRFQMDDVQLADFLSNFKERQMSDTRYASKIAADYLATLYGGRVDSHGALRVRVSAGRVTAYLRDEWKLNAILNDGPSADGGATHKSRRDHRHHAVDAVVVALIDDSMIQKLSAAAERAPLERRRRFGALQGEWPDFTDSVRAEIERIVVSHRVSRKVSGALHEETIYSPPIQRRGPNGKPAGDPEPHVRKPLAALTRTELEDIADPVVRERVLEKLSELGHAEPKKAFANGQNLPFLVARDGRQIPIKGVRLRKRVPTFVLGSDRTARYVTPESNHHVEIFAELGHDGDEVAWDGVVVSVAEAYRRIRSGAPVVERNHGPGCAFKFSLAPGELVERYDGGDERELLIVRSVSCFTTGQIQLGLIPIRDARKKADIVSSGEFLRPGPNTLRQWHARKVAVSPLGKVSEAHD